MDLTVIPKERIMKCPQGQTWILRRDDDSFKWECPEYNFIAKKKRSRCSYSKSLTHGTFFSHSHLSISKISLFVTLWADNVQLNIIGKHVGIASNHTLVDLTSYRREVCYDDVTTNMTPIGGVGETVEIDRYRMVIGKVFPGSGGKPNSGNTCTDYKKYILPGTTIMSDCWKPCEVLGEESLSYG